jgi:hypothetical protein
MYIGLLWHILFYKIQYEIGVLLFVSARQGIRMPIRRDKRQDLVRFRNSS